jgi:hypothetical protein
MTLSLLNNLATTRASNGSVVDGLMPTAIDTGRKHSMTPSNHEQNDTERNDSPEHNRKMTAYTCPMHPEFMSPDPGVARSAA